VTSKRAQTLRTHRVTLVSLQMFSWSFMAQQWPGRLLTMALLPI
jgi:hypothetical protein